MELVDIFSADHSDAIDKIADLARWSHHCRLTKRALQDLIALGLTKEDVLEGVVEHLKSSGPTYKIVQQQTNLIAYVFLPCRVQSSQLYVKVQVPPQTSEMRERLILISRTSPSFQLKEEKE